MSGASETWRVVFGDGSTDVATVTKLDHGMWRAQTAKGISWSVCPTPHAAVADLFDVSPSCVFGPGETPEERAVFAPGETPEERAAFARGVEAMRAAAVAVCLAEGDASVKDAEAATEGDALALARWSAATSLMLSRNIEAITIEPEATK